MNSVLALFNIIVGNVLRDVPFNIETNESNEVREEIEGEESLRGNKPEAPETDKRMNVMKINNNNENIVVNSYKEYLYEYIKMFYTLCS